MDSITPDRVRGLTPRDLGYEPAKAENDVIPTVTPLPPLPDSDATLADVKAAFAMGFAGVILVGPPGTGKSWYARRIAETLAGDPDAIRTIQFHTSYQYQDFMEGYAPDESGAFVVESKIFPSLCEDAAERPSVTHVLMIDEISRCDVARVFGEALTYIEPDKRGIPFTLASGNTLVVPNNLVIVATMNPWDRGVDELDVALERRFAQIDMPPSARTLRTVLQSKAVASEFVDKVVTFFEEVQALDDELCHLGHAYFFGCVDEASARRAWAFRLYPFFKRTCRLDTGTLNSITRMWLKAVPQLAGTDTNGAPANGNQVVSDQSSTIS